MADAYYLVVVKDIRAQNHVTAASDIVSFLLSKSIWVFPPYANPRKLQIGDRLIIYLANPTKAFVAHATIASVPAPIDVDLQAELERLRLTWFTLRVKVKSKRRIVPPIPIQPLIPRLCFIANKKNYGLALRQGLRKLPTADAKVILRR